MYREKIILDLIKDKNVLDIGSIGQTNSYNLWHILNKGRTKSLTGIDLPQAEQEGKIFFNTSPLSVRDQRIVVGNMESYLFNKKFDVIIAGDVIEHVLNQGLFLSNIKRHLEPNGKLLLTTPNAKWPTIIFKPNLTHTLWHDRYTLERMLSYSGFKVTHFSYYSGNKKYNLILRLILCRQAMLVIATAI